MLSVNEPLGWQSGAKLTKVMLMSNYKGYMMSNLIPQYWWMNKVASKLRYKAWKDDAVNLTFAPSLAALVSPITLGLQTRFVYDV